MPYRAFIIYILFICCSVQLNGQKVKAVFLEDISWTSARDILNKESTVVIPLGAGAKEHGPHLPLSTDFIQAEGLKKLVAKQKKVIITPTISYGYYPAFIKYAGSTTTYWHTSRDLIVEIVRTLSGFGPRRFYIINIGVSTTPTLAAAAAILKNEGILLYYSDYRRANFTRIDDELKKTGYGGHADDLESSNVLYLRPDLVDMSKAKNDSSAKNKPGPMTPYELEGGTYNPSGINGYAQLADKKSGKKYLEAFANTLISEIEEVMHAQLPSAADRSMELKEYAGKYMTPEGKIMSIGQHEQGLYYEWGGIERRNFFSLRRIQPDYFSSLPLNILFVRDDLGRISKAWCQLSGEAFWLYKLKE